MSVPTDRKAGFLLYQYWYLSVTLIVYLFNDCINKINISLIELLYIAGLLCNKSWNIDKRRITRYKYSVFCKSYINSLPVFCIYAKTKHKRPKGCCYRGKTYIKFTQRFIKKSLFIKIQKGEIPPRVPWEKTQTGHQGAHLFTLQYQQTQNCCVPDCTKKLYIEDGERYFSTVFRGCSTFCKGV